MAISENSVFTDDSESIKWKKIIYPLLFLTLALFSLSLIFSIAFAPAFVPLFWEIMFGTPSGIIIATSLLIGLTTGLCGFMLKLDNNEVLLSLLPSNKYIKTTLQGLFIFALSATPLALLAFAFPPLSPIIWIMVTLSIGSIMMTSGISIYSQLRRNSEGRSSIYNEAADEAIDTLSLNADMNQARHTNSLLSILDFSRVEAQPAAVVAATSTGAPLTSRDFVEIPPAQQHGGQPHPLRHFNAPTSFLGRAHDDISVSPSESSQSDQKPDLKQKMQ